MIDRVNFKRTIFAIGILAICLRPVVSYADWDDHHGYHDHHDRYYHYHDHPHYGMTIDFIADDFLPVAIDGARYYYYDGLYYAPVRHGYVLVEPPVGAVVPVIPEEYRTVVINGVTYYTDGGVYYIRRHHHEYMIVNPPIVRVAPQTVVVEQPNQSRVAEGVGIGAVVGALTGGIIGHQLKGHQDVGGALVGGVTGAAVGGAIGAQIPNQSTLASAPEVQPAAVDSASTAQTPSDESITVNIPNNQGGYTPVVIKKSGKGYVGPQGEYYPEFPTVAQLKTMYAK